MNILLTGATGFMGFHVAASLAVRHRVTALVRPHAATERLAKIGGTLQILSWDGTTESLPELVRKAAPDAAVHVAGLVIGDHTTQDIDRLIDSNIHFPAVLADALVRGGCRSMIHTGSMTQHHENAAYKASNFYGATKQAAADILTYYVQSGGLHRLITLEPSYVYGPDDPSQRLLQFIDDAARNGKALNLSPGEQFLDFLHIDDVVAGYVHAVDLLNDIPLGEQKTYALRSGKPIQLKNLMDVYRRATGRDIRVNWGARPYRPCEFMEPWSSGTVLPDWQPRIGLEEGLRKVFAAP